MLRKSTLLDFITFPKHQSASISYTNCSVKLQILQNGSPAFVAEDVTLLQLEYKVTRELGSYYRGLTHQIYRVTWLKLLSLSTGKQHLK